MSKAARTNGSQGGLKVDQAKGESNGGALARVMLGPEIRHGHTASTFVAPLLSGTSDKPDVSHYADRMQIAGDDAVAGELAFASRTLAAQALTLDAMFTELARRAAANMGEYVNAAERYARLALKAQTNSRATIEALAKLHQPREQTVRHVHVNEGGKAVIADQFHNHTGAAENGKSIKQPHATSAAGTGAALPSPHPVGAAVPIASGEWQGPVPNARRQRQRGT